MANRSLEFNAARVTETAAAAVQSGTLKTRKAAVRSPPPTYTTFSFFYRPDAIPAVETTESKH